jgi:hypothetical protein
MDFNKKILTRLGSNILGGENDEKKGINFGVGGGISEWIDSR